MAIQRTRWRPDTCDCIFTYTWDDAVPVDQRQHTIVEASRCLHHASLDPSTAYDTVLNSENRVKNLAIADVVAATGLSESAVDFSFDRSSGVELKIHVPPQAMGAVQALHGAFDLKFLSMRVRASNSAAPPKPSRKNTAHQ